jgi:hypothetical protein
MEQTRHTEQHRRMGIMTTGVHLAGNSRFEGQVNIFIEWQGIHIRPNPDFTPFAVAYPCHNACPTNTGLGFYPHFLQRFQH